MGRGTHRGFITYEELSKSLGKRNLSDENLSQAFIHILDENITLVEKKSDFKVLRKKENSNKEEGKTIEKSDDPIRMYLREMGGVELLSREGEIAIAISPSLERSSTPPISLRYIRIGSSLFSIVLPSSFDEFSFFLKTLKSDFFSTKVIFSFKI